MRAAIEGMQLTTAIQIVHGLRFPGTDSADIDHAFVCGDRVLLVDSKHWQPDLYRWYGDAILKGPADKPTSIIRSSFSEAAQRFAKIVSPGRVLPAILIHPSNLTQPISADNSQRGTHPQLLLPRPEILKLCVDWLAEGIPKLPNGEPDILLYQQWQTITMTRVLEQKSGTPQAMHHQQQRLLAEREQEVQRQQAEKRAQQKEQWAREREAKQQRKNAAAAREQREAAQKRKEREQVRWERRQRDVLKMQHDELNRNRGFWGQKKW